MADTQDSAASNRPQFFDRQSLTESDLNALVDYARARARRHNRHIVGWGVTCGLEVSPVDADPWAVRVGPGFALMPSGEEVEVPEESASFDTSEAARACLGIPGPCPAPFDLTDAGGSDTSSVTRRADFTTLDAQSDLPNPLNLRWVEISVFTADFPPPPNKIVKVGPVTGLTLGVHAEFKLALPADRVTLLMARTDGSSPRILAADDSGRTIDSAAMIGPPLTAETIVLVGEGINRIIVTDANDAAFLMAIEIGDEVLGRVFLALCPDENPARFQPGVPDYCRPVGDNIHPSRICEGYRLEVLCNLPEGHLPITCAQAEALVCGDQHLPCPPADGPDCVVIAALSIGETGILAIDEHTHRRRLLPHWLLAHRLRCTCNEPQTPTPPPTSTPPPTPTPSPTPTPIPSTITDFTSVTFVPTILTEFPTTIPSIFTGLPTIVTFEPSGITGPPIFTDIIGNPLPPGGVFDPDNGRGIDVSELSGIGPRRAARLQAAGIVNLTDFIGAGSERLSDILGLSEVRVAGMQEEARARTLERRG